MISFERVLISLIREYGDKVKVDMLLLKVLFEGKVPERVLKDSGLNEEDFTLYTREHFKEVLYTLNDKDIDALFSRYSKDPIEVEKLLTQLALRGGTRFRS